MQLVVVLVVLGSELMTVQFAGMGMKAGPPARGLRGEAVARMGREAVRRARYRIVIWFGSEVLLLDS